MATKSDFTPEEWTNLLESAMLASIAVTAADPSGLWGMLQEGWANAKGLISAKGSPTPLIAAVVDELGTSDGRGIAQEAIKARMAGATSADVVARCLAALAAIAELVDRKAAADAPGFKRWLMENAQRVAEASTEGGFLGFGGAKVSEKEKITLYKLSATLKV